MGTVRKVIAAAALAGLMAAIPLSASAEPAAPNGKSAPIVVNGGSGDWPLAR